MFKHFKAILLILLEHLKKNNFCLIILLIIFINTLYTSYLHSLSNFLWKSNWKMLGSLVLSVAVDLCNRLCVKGELI
jgi:hypothetical protein